MSKTLPWRTLATPAMPSDFRAPSMALPWGSRIPDLSVTVTRAFMIGPVLCQTSVAIDLREAQAEPEIREFDRIVEPPKPLLRKSLVSGEYHDFDCVLGDHHVVRQRGQAGVGRPLPTQIAIGRGLRQDLEGDD